MPCAVSSSLDSGAASSSCGMHPVNRPALGWGQCLKRQGAHFERVDCSEVMLIVCRIPTQSCWSWAPR